MSHLYACREEIAKIPCADERAKCVGWMVGNYAWELHVGLARGCDLHDQLYALNKLHDFAVSRMMRERNRIINDRPYAYRGRYEHAVAICRVIHDRIKLVEGYLANSDDHDHRAYRPSHHRKTWRSYVNEFGYWDSKSSSGCWKDQRGKGRKKRTTQYHHIPHFDLYVPFEHDECGIVMTDEQVDDMNYLLTHYEFSAVAGLVHA